MYCTNEPPSLSVHDKDYLPCVFLQVEELLREKITQYWKNVAENLMLYDAEGKGYVTPKQMKRVIERQVMPVSDDHFAQWVRGDFSGLVGSSVVSFFSNQVFCTNE